MAPSLRRYARRGNNQDDSQPPSFPFPPVEKWLINLKFLQDENGRPIYRLGRIQKKAKAACPSASRDSSPRMSPLQLEPPIIDTLEERIFNTEREKNSLLFVRFPGTPTLCPVSVNKEPNKTFLETIDACEDSKKPDFDATYEFTEGAYPSVCKFEHGSKLPAKEKHKVSELELITILVPTQYERRIPQDV